MRASTSRVGIFAILWLLATVGRGSAADLKSIGVSLPSLAIAFFSEVDRGIRSAARRLAPDADVHESTYDNSVEKQIAQLQAMISIKPQLIIIFPSDRAALGPLIEMARAAGIVVVAVGENLERANASIGTNSQDAGERACQYLADQLSHKGNVAIINGPPGSLASDRVTGCEKALAKYTEIKLVSSDENGQWSEAGGEKAMHAVLSKYPNIDGIFAVSSEEARGSERAVRSEGRRVTAIVSVGNTILDSEGIGKEAMIAGVVIQRAFSIGAQAVEAGFRLISGEKLPNTYVSVPTVLITRQTLDSYPDCCRLVPPTCNGCQE